MQYFYSKYHKGMLVCACIFVATMPLYGALDSKEYATNTESSNIESSIAKSSNIESHMQKGIPKDERKIDMFGNDFYILPFFTIQVGMGAAHTKNIADTASAITSFGMPTFMLGIGFAQHYYIAGFNFGYKLQLAYEIGVKTLGENTMAFRSAGGFFQVHVGYKYVLPYFSVGYEMLSVAKNFIPSANENVLYTDRGISYGFGANILLHRYHSLDISARFASAYGFYPRFLVAYEFRF